MRQRRGRTLRHQNSRHDLDGQPDTLIYLPRSRIVRKGIARAPRERTAATRPLTEAQAEVLALLTDRPQQAVEIARQLGQSASGVTSRLYALSARGLAEHRLGQGWRRLTEPTTTQED